MREIVFFLEERSAQAMLEALLPRIAPELTVRFVVFEGRQDLERQLVRKLRGFLNPDARFIVMRDQDAHPECRQVKQKLVDLCSEAGRPEAVVRIACHELESFYLADLAAVAKALELPSLAGRQGRRKFRAPDQLGQPSQELARLTDGKYQKLSGSRAIGAHLDPNNDRSPSFRCLVDAVRRLAQAD